LTSGCLARGGLHPIRQRQLCGLVGTSSVIAWAPSSEHFAGPQGEHHVRSATPGVSGRRRHGLAGRSQAGGREWRVDSSRFPIAKTITGVVLDLDPGALRTLHWHPNADEWQYVVEGEVSVTLFGSHGRYRIERLQKGEVGYMPQGYGHSIENVDSGAARIMIGFNAGIYETIDLSQWIATNPKDVLATNFGKPAEVFGKFPNRDVFIAGKDS
jgi:oxalate decarboxylase/phosphoglucose isomerase-like protein (cupin superfamily)